MTIVAFLALAVVIGTWLGIRAAAADQALKAFVDQWLHLTKERGALDALAARWLQ